MPLAPTLVVLLALPLLAALGVWQLHRLHWKTALLEQLASAPKLPVLDHPDLARPGLDFRRAVVDCKPTADAPQVRAGRNARGEVGYSYLLKCTGSPLTLDAGWAPRPDAKPFRLAAAYPGMLREHPGPAYTLIAARALPPLEPSAPPTVEEVPNNHLSYAIQWFLFGGVLVVIYGIYVVRWRRGSLDLPLSRR